jgi:hypothetical protein
MLQRKWYNDKDEITMVEHYSPIKSHDLLLYGDSKTGTCASVGGGYYLHGGG